jgi:hypothetical protein
MSHPHGYFGIASKENTQVDFDDVQVALDTDADGVADSEEVNGHNVVREAAIYPVLHVGQYLLQVPPGSGDATFVFSARAPRGGLFDFGVYAQNAALGKGNGAQLAGPSPFYGAGVFATYAFTTTNAVNSGDLYVDFKFVGKSFDGDVTVAWIGIVSNNLGGHRAAFTVSASAEGVVGSGLDYTGQTSDITYVNIVDRETMQWEFNDFDFDQMADGREGRMALRTTIPYGFVTDGNWGASTGASIIWDGVSYQCLVDAQTQSCRRYVDSTVASWDLLGSTPNGAEIRGVRTSSCT